MPPFENLQFDPETFSGTVRLFPLPNLVMFPHVLQPLHIFEPRYCEMFEAALAGDQFIAMALLAPGWEMDYEGRPPVYPTVCLGKIATHVRLPDGRYNLLLAGMARVRLEQELTSDTLYRQATARLCVERYPASLEDHKQELTQQLLTAFRRVLPETTEALGPLSHLLHQGISLNVLTDIVAYTLDFDVQTKAELLAECDICVRAQKLLNSLGARQGAAHVPFPPDFSCN